MKIGKTVLGNHGLNSPTVLKNVLCLNLQEFLDLKVTQLLIWPIRRRVTSTLFFFHSLKQALVFTCLQYKPFENTVGKGKIAPNEQFLLFPHSVFYPFGELSTIFMKLKKLLSANSTCLEEKKICRLEKS